MNKVGFVWELLFLSPSDYCWKISKVLHCLLNFFDSSETFTCPAARYHLVSSTSSQLNFVSLGLENSQLTTVSWVNPPSTTQQKNVPSSLCGRPLPVRVDTYWGLPQCDAVSSPRPGPRCRMCSLTFYSKSEMQIHSKSHTETKPHKCPHCSKSFANSSYLAQHIRIHSGAKPYTCSYCQKAFRQLSHLQQHTR